MAQKIIGKTLIILLILFPLGELFRFQLTQDAGVTVNDIAVGIASVIVVWVFILQRREKKKEINQIIVPFIPFIVVCLLSLIVHFAQLKFIELVTAFLYIVRWVSYLFIGLSLQLLEKNEKRQVLPFMIYAGTAVCFIGLVQYLLYPNLRNLYYLGWDEHLYRLFSSFLDPNFAGAFLVLFFLFITGLILSIPSAQYRIRLSGIALMLIVLISIILTYSRSAFFMLATGIIMLFILGKKARYILISIIICVFLLLLSQIAFKSEGTNLLRASSTLQRVDSAAKAIQIIRDNPIIGVGFDAYRYAQMRYGFLKNNKDYPNHAGAGTDNSFLFILATTGIVGFASFMYLLFRILSNGRKVYRQKSGLEKQMAVILISSIGSIVLGSFFNNNLFYPFLMEWIWILYGITVNI